MKYWKNRLGVKLAVTITLILIPMLLASFLWFEYRAETMVKNEQEVRGAQVAESLVATLSSIMLSGNANIAHFWLKRVASVPGVESAKIFRTDGVEAFQDRATLDQVNSYIGKQQFVRATVEQPGKISAELLAPFNMASKGKANIRHSKDNEHLNYMSPIRAEGACMGCHGYDSNPIRGVLVLGLTTGSYQVTASEIKRDMINVLILIIALFGLTIWLVVRRKILIPLETITKVAANIRQGDLSNSIELNRDDELGLVASTFDLLVHDLKQKILHEADQRKCQEAITDAVISLGREAAGVPLLKHIGELSM